LGKRILLIAVNYNSSKETLDFLNSISGLNNFQEIQVVIVDNSDQIHRDLGFSSMCKQIINDVLFVETSSNHFYFGSVNFALQFFSLNPNMFDFFIISNVDILIKDNLFLDNISSIKLENIGIIAPSIFSTAKGNDQNPYMIKRFNKFMFYYYYFIRQHLFFTILHEKFTEFLKKERSYIKNRSVSSGTIYSPHGAFIIFTNQYFQLGGSIDFGLKLFGEELFVAEECRRIKLDVYYEPKISVLHNEHISTGAVSSKFVVEKKLESVIYFLKKFK
jgi:GT2 family glycosyltransferase